MICKPNRIQAVLLVASLSVLSLVPGAFAQVGLLGQNNSAVTYANPDPVGPAACAPVSVANGLTYLNNLYSGNVFTSTPNSYATVNTLAQEMGTTFNGTTGGTSFANEVSGLNQYLATSVNSGYNVSIVGGQYVSSTTDGGTVVGNVSGVPASVVNAIPTVSALASDLNAHDAVEVWIQWGYYRSLSSAFCPLGGLHSVTLTSISDNSISFVDPWGNGTASATASATAYSAVDLETSASGFLYLPNQYFPSPEQPSESGDGTEAGYGANLLTGRIVTDLAESVTVVPEPSTWLTGALMLIPLGKGAFRRFRASRNAE
jgi:hypothetical protein